MAAGQLWAGVDVGKENHWVCVVDDTGAVVLSRKLVNDEQPIRALVGEIDSLGEQVAWTVDLTTVYAALLLTVLAGAGKSARVLANAGIRNAATIAAAAVAAAKSQTVRLPGEEVAAGLVAQLAQAVIALDDRIKAADADIEGRFRRHPLAEVITSLPGIRFRLGAEFLAAVGDPALIGSADQLAA